MKKLLTLLVLAGALCACAAPYQEMRAPCSITDCKNRIPVNVMPSGD